MYRCEWSYGSRDSGCDCEQIANMRIQNNPKQPEPIFAKLLRPLNRQKQPERNVERITQRSQIQPSDGSRDLLERACLLGLT